jgi:putative phage-type endonuclease
MPIERTFQQGTPAWREWRRKGIGASDAPVIMGASPWSTPVDLWLLKTGQVAERPPNWAMRRGTALEDTARRQYMKRTGLTVAPTCFEHHEHTWMRGSLDGFHAAHALVVEIKCPGRQDHGTAVAGRVPAKYVAQLQHLMVVAAARACHYVSYREDELVILEVAPDPAYMTRLVRAEAEFWACVREGRRPEGLDS